MSRVPSLSTKKLLEKLTTQYQSNLDCSPDALSYLEARGITKEVANYFRVGFVTNPVPEERIFEGRLSIPFIVGKSVVGIKYRSIDDTEPKYISSVGFYAQRIFNPNILQHLYPKIYLCTGEINVITLHQLKIPAIGIPGANNYDPVVARALRNRHVVVLVDGDAKPGKGQESEVNFGKKVLTSIDGGAKIQIEGSDVNQFFLDHGEKALKEYIGWTASV